METLCQVESDVEASRISAQLIENGIEVSIIRLGDSAYPGVTDRARPHAVIRVPASDLAQAKTIMAAYGDRENTCSDTDKVSGDLIGEAWRSAPHPDQVAPRPPAKSPVVAALLTLLVPGTGQFYSDRFVAAAFIFATWVFAWFCEPRLMIVVALIAAVDAYRGCSSPPGA